MGWIAGPAVLLLFAFCTYYTSRLLAECYRSPDSETGKRNYIYMDAVKANLGRQSIFFMMPAIIQIQSLMLEISVRRPTEILYDFPCLANFLAMGGGNVGRKQVLICGLTQYSNLVGTSIGYTIAAATSAA